MSFYKKLIILFGISLIVFYGCDKLLGPENDKHNNEPNVPVETSPFAKLTALAVNGANWVVDFEGIPAGTIVSSVVGKKSGESDFGPISVNGSNDLFPAVNTAIIFDSDCPGGAGSECSGVDFDLGTPNEKQGSGGHGIGVGGEPGATYENTLALGNILIIAENLDGSSGDGIVDDPDDQGDDNTQRFTFVFPEGEEVTILSISVIDIEPTEDGIEIILLNASDTPIFTSVPYPQIGDNGVVKYTIEDEVGEPSVVGVPDVATMYVDLHGSGGIDEIEFDVPIEILSCDLQIVKYTVVWVRDSQIEYDAFLVADAPTVLPGDEIFWRYYVTNSGVDPIDKADITLVDNILGDITADLKDDADGDDIFGPGETWMWEVKGTALDNGPSQCYENVGTVTAFVGDEEATCQAFDLSHYCNPDPEIDIEKHTNGVDADVVDQDTPELAPGDDVTWEYFVENIGTVAILKSEITVTDDQPGVTPVYLSGDTGPDGILTPGEIWVYVATGKASDLLEAGCYENYGKVTVQRGSNDPVIDEDPSHYCNPGPRVDIEKHTNDVDADDVIDAPTINPGETITWKYWVENTGKVAILKSEITVTDDQPGVTPVYASGDLPVILPDEILSPGEIWLYTATSTAPSRLEGGCYENKGKVVVQRGTEDPVDDEDPSHYCLPLPKIEIDKVTNGSDGPSLIPGEPVVWTYTVTNIGLIPLNRDEIDVTDNRGVTPLYVSGDTGPDNVMDPGEFWIYKARGRAAAVGSRLLDGKCYRNIGRVTIIGAEYGQLAISDSDPSGYCIKLPGIEIDKVTNGSDGPLLIPGEAIVWTYTVKNTGDVPFARSEISVTDSEGVKPIVYISGDTGGDDVMDPGEVWIYKARGQAAAIGELTEDCYSNTGYVTATGTYYGQVLDDDDSDYCLKQPGIEIDKVTNDVDDLEIIAGEAITWTYTVTNTGDVPFARSEISVTDSDLGVTPTYVSGDTPLRSGDDVMDPGEVWIYEATGVAAPLGELTEGCYTNTGFVTATGTYYGQVLDDDDSGYCVPDIEIIKLTNDLNDDDGDIILSPGTPVWWTYIVTNTGGVPFAGANVTVTDDQGVTPVYLSGDTPLPSGDNILSPGETWLYEVAGEPVSQDCYANIGTVTATGSFGFVDDNDNSSYCIEDCHSGCESQIVSLQLKYGGTPTTYIHVYQLHHGWVFNELVDTDDIFLIEDGLKEFKNKPWTLGNELLFFFTSSDVKPDSSGVADNQIHTSCSDPAIVPGYTFSDLTILSVTDWNGYICRPTVNGVLH